MKKKLFGVVLCAGFVVGGGGTAFAGEVNGNGGSTPIRDRATYCFADSSTTGALGA